MICFACGAATGSDPCESCQGPALAGGRYRVEALAGRHHWRTTWLAHAVASNREVVIWEIPLPAGLDSSQRADFQRAAGANAGQRHRGFAEVLDTLVVTRGRTQALLVVEARVPGRTLRAVLDEGVDGAFPVDRTLLLVSELLESLSWLHDRSPPGTHGDIRPETIVLADDATGRGVSVVLVGAFTTPPAGQGTVGAVASGTPGYTAPERLRGDLDPRSDLYAVGAVALSMLAGRDARTLQDQTGRHRWEKDLDLHRGLSLLLGDLVQPDPTRRISTARRALQRVAEVRIALAVGPGIQPSSKAGHAPDDRTARGLSRARARMEGRYSSEATGGSNNLLLFLVGVALIVAALVAWREWREPSPETPVSTEPIH